MSRWTGNEKLDKLRSQAAASGTGTIVVSIEQLNEILGNEQNRTQQLRADVITLGMRLMGEEEESFSPEVSEVMSRWRTHLERALSVSRFLINNLTKPTSNKESL
jgi:hypothetical protein